MEGRPLTKSGSKSPLKRRSSSSASFKLSTSSPGEIINLNVGGQKFATSKYTLTSIPETFFTALLSGNIPSLKDATGATFIDRDPSLFSVILNYLRTRQLNLEKYSLEALKHEAEFYGISPLVKKIEICYDSLDTNSCGNVMFQAQLKPSSLTKQMAGINFSEEEEYNPVVQIVAHHNAIAVAHSHSVTCYRFRDSLGWQCIYKSDKIEKKITGMAFCYNCGMGPASASKLTIGLTHENDHFIRLWCVTLVININNEVEPTKNEIGRFKLNSCHINALFFIGAQLVALGCDQGRVGVYHAMSQHWLVQDLGQCGHQAITAYDKAGCNFLLLGSRLGAIYLIDMQKFPLRMKDGDLLINELYEDPELEEITAISCYLTRTPKNNGNWLEIAYGTQSGTVRVLVQHPETVGHGPQLFQTFKVHLNGINRVMLSEKYLISMCNKMHVRTWTLTRFRGRISTQPGSTPHASFKLLMLDDNSFDQIRDNPNEPSYSSDFKSVDVGPFGDQDDGDKQVFVERLLTCDDRLRVLTASSGKKVCDIRSVDGSVISTYCVHECEALAMGNRSRRYILTGHSNGYIQVWDLSTGFDLTSKSIERNLPTPEDLLKELL
ncbi:BTB/POZ domain-containing protein KCTD3 [Halotydeus destructor]|nr:BTB/POZ domain-containing protein KCTD3 [Halotydeus destructor]